MIRADYQSRVAAWACECFGEEIANDKATCNYRFLAEALELVQSLGCTKEDALKLVDYVYSRPVGVPFQEVDGVLITLYALASANDLSVAEAGWQEFYRINTPEVIAKIRAKQKNKPNPRDVLPALESQNLRHPDDGIVDAFAAAMREKLAKKRVEFGDGWREADPAKLRVMMTEHMRKGDPIDVANFAMFLWHRHQSTGIVYSRHPGMVDVQRDDGKVVGSLTVHFPEARVPDAIRALVEHAEQNYDAERALIADETEYHMNDTASVAIADGVYYNPMETCPRGAKVLLLGPYGVATLGVYDGDPQWRGWFPLPKERK